MSRQRRFVGLVRKLTRLASSLHRFQSSNSALTLTDGELDPFLRRPLSLLTILIIFLSSYSRVLQRCFEHLPQEQTRSLLDEMHEFTQNLVLDQFGNYGSYFFLDLFFSHESDRIIPSLILQSSSTSSSTERTRTVDSSSRNFEDRCFIVRPVSPSHVRFFSTDLASSSLISLSSQVRFQRLREGHHHRLA